MSENNIVTEGIYPGKFCGAEVVAAPDYRNPGQKIKKIVWHFMAVDKNKTGFCIDGWTLTDDDNARLWTAEVGEPFKLDERPVLLHISAYRDKKGVARNRVHHFKLRKPGKLWYDAITEDEFRK